jgi:hypothetical protein
MPVRVGTSVFHDWVALQLPPAGWTDTFIFEMKYDAGLPPDDYAEGLRKLVWQLNKIRRGASIWVKVDAPGLWYEREVRRVLRGMDIAIAVTPSAVSSPRPESFSLIPYTIKVPSGPPPQTDEWYLGDLSKYALACLRACDRLHEAYTTEIAAMVGIGIDLARKIMRELVEKGYVEYINDFVKPAKPRQIALIGDKTIARTTANEKRSYPFWQVTRKGSSIALRSWGLPPDYYFPQRKEFRTPKDSRHRRSSRQWPAWLRKAWPHAEIWAGWSEVSIKGLDATPDALAWGRLDGSETLFWLEVESGHSSREVIQKKLSRRLSQASAYTESMKIRLVFVLLAMPWVQEAARAALTNIPNTVAVVTGDWLKFGELPVVEWGKVRLSTETA